MLISYLKVKLKNTRDAHFDHIDWANSRASANLPGLGASMQRPRGVYTRLSHSRSRGISYIEGNVY